MTTSSTAINKQNPLFHAFNAASEALISGLMIGMPGHIVAYNPDTNRAQVQCAIQRKTPGGAYESLPVLINVPVQLTGSGGWTVFHELPDGTEGYVHFSQSAVDSWLDAGGEVAPPDNRMFSASDAFFAPGYRSLKTAIPGLPVTGIGMSNRDGSMRIHLTNSGVTITAGGSVLSLTPSGLTHNGINIGATHVHGGVEPGGSKSDIPE
ncbi:Gp138 family membrane-puncturing spike protein [Dickeya undicola]|uniref:Gp138 family membrane-puncturing spike protein n=1 Tax=Dickeya undicola TaxID=1577887 RepID=UPI003F2491CF